MRIDIKHYCQRFFLLLFFAAASLHTKANDDWKKKVASPAYLHRSLKQVTDVMVHDIYSPPVAARIYAYVSVAAYEAGRLEDKTTQSLAGQLHQLNSLPKPVAGKEYCYSLASVNALLEVAKSMLISEGRISSFQKQMLAEIRLSGIPPPVFEKSIAFGKQIAAAVIAWASKDLYNQTRSLAKYAVDNNAGSWKPTPPAYMKAIEPHWGKLRTFLIDSAQEFKPLPPTSFSIDSSSQFYQEAKAVYDAGINLTAEQKEVANFWDCNPFKMNVNGHVMYATKKISPGGHWINIATLACKQANADVVKSAEVYAAVSIALADCFISCWDEKYRSRVIRPETYINQYISQSWMPLLQTPPFPEYTSGHSVVSGACAVVLSKYFGGAFAFSDSTETEFELPVRNFTSFKQAAEEAAISRFYGGIHYMPAIVNGLKEGTDIGVFVCEKMRTRKATTAAVQ